MADKAKVSASKSADEMTQGPATGAVDNETQNKNGVKATVNPELQATSVSFPDGEGGLQTFAMDVTHVVSKSLLELKDANGTNYLVKAE